MEAVRVRHGLPARRHLPARQFFAHHHRQCLFHGRIGPVGHGRQIGLGVTVFQHGIDIVADARHAIGADGLHTGLFDSVENGAGLLSGRCQRRMGLHIMARTAQRHGIAEPA